MFGDTSYPLYSFFTYIIIRWYNNNSIPLKRYIILLIYHYTISPDMFFGNEHDKEYPITPSVVPNKSCVLLYNHNRCLYYSATLLYCIVVYCHVNIIPVCCVHMYSLPLPRRYLSTWSTLHTRLPHSNQFLRHPRSSNNIGSTIDSTKRVLFPLQEWEPIKYWPELSHLRRGCIVIPGESFENRSE